MNGVVLAGHADRVAAVAWLNNQQLVTGSFDSSIRIWKVAEGQAERTLSAHQDQVLALAASASERLVASGGKDRVVKLWRLDSTEPPSDIATHSKAVLCVAFSPDGKLLASCGEDDTRILVWDVTAGKSLKQLAAEDPDDKNQKRSLHSLAFSSDGKQLVSGGADRTVRLWDVAQGKELRRLEAVEYQLFTEKDNRVQRVAKKAAAEFPVYAVAISPDGKRIASGGLDKTVRIWNAATGELTHTLANQPGFVYHLSFLGGSDRLLCGSHSGQISVWKIGDVGPLIRTQVPSLTTAMAVSPDGTRLAAACQDSQAYVVALPAADSP